MLGKVLKMLKRLVVLSLVLFVSLQVYSVLFKVHQLPDLELDQWWGPKKAPNTPLDDSITNFTIEFTPEMKKYLLDRLNKTNLPTPALEGIGFQDGFNHDFLKDIVNFWKTRYNFESRQSFLNAYPHFKTSIQGMDIHYVHVVPEQTENLKVIPLVLLHGWPSSFVEYFKMVPYLTTPRPGKTFVFELIIPSLPGFGYSQGPSKQGFKAHHAAVVVKNLMDRLGHHRFVVKGGGNWGSMVGSAMATIFPKNVIGYHTNFPLVQNDLAIAELIFSAIVPQFYDAGKAPARIRTTNQLQYILPSYFYKYIQAFQHDTVGAAFEDSPAGLAAGILEKFALWTNATYIHRADGGLTKKFIMTELLDNVMVYWHSKCITTSTRVFGNSFSENNPHGVERVPTQKSVPVAIAKLMYDHINEHSTHVYRSKFTSLVRLSEVQTGHFGSFEAPDMMAADIWAAMVQFGEFHKAVSKKTEL